MAKSETAAKRDLEPRREQVLRVAEALFARAGYRGVGLREIAAQVGIRAPSLFKHFESKHELYNAVLLNIFARLDEVAGCLAGNASFAEGKQYAILDDVDAKLHRMQDNTDSPRARI